MQTFQPPYGREYVDLKEFLQRSSKEAREIAERYDVIHFVEYMIPKRPSHGTNVPKASLRKSRCLCRISVKMSVF